MSIAICKAIFESRSDYKELGENAITYMQKIGRRYPLCGYGGNFLRWIFSKDPKPYGSFGNGAAMRVSGCGFAASSLDEAKLLSQKVTEVTHNHPEGLKGAEATAVAVYLAKTGMDKEEIRQYIDKNYYSMNFTLNEIRPKYEFDVSCQGSVPQALAAFFESIDFEDTIRNAISIGGDSDTIAAIARGVAEVYYRIPQELKKKTISYLNPHLLEIASEFEAEFQ